jgi:hypothetical protein
MNTLFRALTAVFSIAAGVLHWNLWANHGYRTAPVRELFIASAVIGVAVGLIAIVERANAGLPAAAVNAVFLGAFALSRVAELPTLHGGWTESGLAPESATLLLVPTTLILLVCEGLAVVCGVASAYFGRERSGPGLPAEFARA